MTTVDPMYPRSMRLSHISIAIVCVEFPCNVSWNWQMARELSSGHRMLAGYNGCVASYTNIQTGFSDTYLSLICSAKAGSTFGPVNNGYAMVLSTNNDKYRVWLFDWTNYQKYLTSDSTQQCVSGSNCVILDGKLKQTYNTPCVALHLANIRRSRGVPKLCLVNAAGPFAVTASNPQPWEYTNACSSPYSTISTTSQYQMIAFICSAQAGATFGRSANGRTMIDSSQYDKFQVFLYDWTSYQNWNLGLSATCKNSGCNNIIDTGIGPGYDTSVAIPTTDNLRCCGRMQELRFPINLQAQFQFQHCHRIWVDINNHSSSKHSSSNLAINNITKWLYSDLQHEHMHQRWLLRMVWLDLLRSHISQLQHMHGWSLYLHVSEFLSSVDNVPAGCYTSSYPRLHPLIFSHVSSDHISSDANRDQINCSNIGQLDCYRISCVFPALMKTQLHTALNLDAS
ncbi:hypothetical protein AeMF1_007534 [Aphanomyces euteiches]|nr:hypothetical protein AeMF1_007534 [Aphanomyces euteiches]KAH9168979.1 hypothetical protein AeNC1_017797 [Aphanomyces euteiches]